MSQILAPVIIKEIKEFSGLINEEKAKNEKEIKSSNLFNYFISYHSSYKELLEFILVFRRETKKSMQYFNAEIISKNIFNGFYEIENKKLFISNLEKINVFLEEKIVINNEYIKAALLFKELSFCHNKNEEDFFNHYKKLKCAGLCISEEMFINCFLNSEKIDKKLIFIYNYFFKGHDNAKLITFMLSESEKGNINKKINIDNRFSCSLKNLSEEKYFANINSLACLHRFLDSTHHIKNNKIDKNIITKFITENMKENALRIGEIYIQQIKSIKFNPFIYSMEIWHEIFKNKYLIDMFDNEAVMSQHLNFYNDKNLIENYLDYKLSLHNDKNYVMHVFKTEVIPFIKNISNNPFKDSYGTGCFVNMLIDIMDKYSDKNQETIEKEYIEMIEYYLEKFSPSEMSIDKNVFTNIYWKSYIENKFLKITIKNDVNIKTARQRL